MTKTTIYACATSKMKEIIVELLTLAGKTNHFTSPDLELWKNDDAAIMLLAGKNVVIDDITSESKERRENLWLQMAAAPFNLELAATKPLYKELLSFTDNLIRDAYLETSDFTVIEDNWIFTNPQYLPVVMHVLSIFSKQKLVQDIGAASDNKISKNSAIKLTKLLKSIQKETIPSQHTIQQRIRSTTEGIVRDVVGRLLLEEFVDYALSNENISFKREHEYDVLTGVLYDFRADFVVPDEVNPLAFIEVRKSSSRHASLYAKDKMFSAINWKGKHQRCLGILVIDGPWTIDTIRIMSRIFDYVVPITQVNEIAKKIKSYVDGDESVLNWLVQFKIERPNEP